MSRLTRIGVAVSYLSLAAVPLYGASVNSEQVQDVPAVSKPAARDASRVESFRSQLQGNRFSAPTLMLARGMSQASR